MLMRALDFYEWGVKSASFVMEDILIHNVGLIMSLLMVMIMKVAVRPQGAPKYKYYPENKQRKDTIKTNSQAKMNLTHH